MDEEDQCVECGNQLDHGEFEASEILKGKRLC